MITQTREMQKIAPFYDGWEETMIWSCLEGCMGRAFVKSEGELKSAKIVTADFMFLAGEPDEELVAHKPEGIGDFTIMVPSHEGWNGVIERVHGDKAKKVCRYAVKKEGDVFDKNKLEQLAKRLPEGFEIRMIDENLYHQSQQQIWSADLCSQFNGYEDYKERGIGVAVVKGGMLVAGASSYTVYKKGIEVEIDTRKDCRRQGLALVCGARLILECLKRGRYPSWDAHNEGSLLLAEKLGYHFDKEYMAYEVVME